MQEELKQMVDEARQAYSHLAQGLPDKATNAAQQELADKHGTPKVFAEACIRAIGEISVDEAREAIRDYRHRWSWAGYRPSRWDRFKCWLGVHPDWVRISTQANGVGFLEQCPSCKRGRYLNFAGHASTTGKVSAAEMESYIQNRENAET